MSLDVRKVQFATLTPPNIEWACTGETIRNNFDDVISASYRPERDQERLKSYSPNAKEDQNVHDKEFIVSVTWSSTSG